MKNNVFLRNNYINSKDGTLWHWFGTLACFADDNTSFEGQPKNEVYDLCSTKHVILKLGQVHKNFYYHKDIATKTRVLFHKVLVGNHVENKSFIGWVLEEDIENLFLMNKFTEGGYRG